MNELIWGLALLIIGLILTTIGGFKANDGWNKLKNKDQEKNDQTTFNVKSENQSGGITTGNIENLNITTNKETNEEQKRKDSQSALIYQTEILHFYQKFKTCLHWTLPFGNNTDLEIDSTFNYATNFTKGIEFNRISKKLIVKIFTDYNFREVMPNYSSDNNLRPTGFNNILGIFGYFNSQLGKQLNKYGSTISTDLSTRIEYMQRTTQSTITSLRLDLKTNNKTTIQSANNIAELLVLMRDDYLLMKSEYTKDITGGYPVTIGNVTKSDEKDGEIIVETQFSNY